MIRLPRPHAVILDMDGLMIDSESIYRAAWFEAIPEFGREIDDPIFRRFLGRNARDAQLLLTEIYGSDFPAPDFVRRASAIALTRLGPEGMPPKSGLGELLDFLDASAIAKTVATSTGRPTALRSLGPWAARFPIITSGEEILQGKPAPDIFLLAARRLGIDPARCLVLEDSEAGVHAARAAGMPVIMVPDLVAPTEEMTSLASGVLNSLHEVRELLAGVLHAPGGGG